MKIAEIEKYISDDMLDAIYESRCDTLSFWDFVSQDEDCKRIEKEHPISSNDVMALVRSLPNSFEKLKKQIIRSFDRLVSKQNLITSYYSEQCYKVGFCDGIRTLLESQKLQDK